MIVLPDCIGMNIDEAIVVLRQADREIRIALLPTFDPKFKGEIALSKMIVLRQRENGKDVELVIVEA